MLNTELYIRMSHILDFISIVLSNALKIKLPAAIKHPGRAVLLRAALLVSDLHQNPNLGNRNQTRRGLVGSEGLG